MRNNYPLASEKIIVTEDILSEYYLQIIENSNVPLGKNKNLMPHLGNKEQKDSTIKT